MEYRVFLVEDDQRIARAIAQALLTWNIETIEANDFQNVLSEVAETNPHLILMDLSLPFFNGFYWTKEIRKLNNTPIIFISSSNENMNAIMAMNMGADDFLCKPFDMSLLVAKIQALLRRSYDFAGTNNILQHEGVYLCASDNTVMVNDQKIDLTKNEYRILYLLMRSKEEIVTREKLIEALWQTDEFIDDNTLTVNINRLRKKLAQYGLEDFIVTKFGEGYRLK